MVYGSLLHERRRALHARAIAAIEGLYPERLAEHVECLAHHALRGEAWPKAVLYLRQSGVYDEKGTGRRIQGIGQIIEAFQGWAKAIPDSKATFVAEYASGDTAVLEVVWIGVHAGPLQTRTGTIPASNKRIEVPACQVFKIEGGKIKSFTHYFDMVTLLTQIGAFKG